ncbi:MAG: hypothetical protein QM537_04680 [Candidatus Symbiobacter sp.]|nr:hypothetical protein [Candidatus Symbiobacter sp.]
MVNTLETLIKEYLEIRGYFVKTNVKVGKLLTGGYEGELDVVGFNPNEHSVYHYEAQLDAKKWDERIKILTKKMAAGRQYIAKEVFVWPGSDAYQIKQIAICINAPTSDLIKSNDLTFDVMGIDDFMSKEIIHFIKTKGIVFDNAISETYPLLRALQFALNGYSRRPKIDPPSQT